MEIANRWMNWNGWKKKANFMFLALQQLSLGQSKQLFAYYILF